MGFEYSVVSKPTSAIVKYSLLSLVNTFEGRYRVPGLLPLIAISQIAARNVAITLPGIEVS